MTFKIYKNIFFFWQIGSSLQFSYFEKRQLQVWWQSLWWNVFFLWLVAGMLTLHCAAVCIYVFFWHINIIRISYISSVYPVDPRKITTGPNKSQNAKFSNYFWLFSARSLFIKLCIYCHTAGYHRTASWQLISQTRPVVMCRVWLSPPLRNHIEISVVIWRGNIRKTNCGELSNLTITISWMKIS